jgi:hypothetical protein
LPGRNRNPINASTDTATCHAGLLLAVVATGIAMASVVVAGLLPGVTVDGWKLAVAPVGSPLAEKLIELLKDPFCGVAVIV